MPRSSRQRCRQLLIGNEFREREIGCSDIDLIFCKIVELDKDSNLTNFRKHIKLNEETLPIRQRDKKDLQQMGHWCKEYYHTLAIVGPTHLVKSIVKVQKKTFINPFSKNCALISLHKFVKSKWQQISSTHIWEFEMTFWIIMNTNLFSLLTLWITNIL